MTTIKSNESKMSIKSIYRNRLVVVSVHNISLKLTAVDKIAGEWYKPQKAIHVIVGSVSEST